MSNRFPQSVAGLLKQSEMPGSYWVKGMRGERADTSSPWDAIRKARDSTVNFQRAGRCFPNNVGGYPGKRKERPLVAPLSPADRLARLKAAYLAFAVKMKEPRITFKRRGRNAWAVIPGIA